ncbi:MAG: hypothetical protein R3E42_16590 [Burkholderiaceae bacterium]
MSPANADHPNTACWPHADGLHLVLSSLGEVVVATGVTSVRAEDASGGFGLWPGHADFLTVLGGGVELERPRRPLAPLRRAPRHDDAQPRR